MCVSHKFFQHRLSAGWVIHLFVYLSRGNLSSPGIYAFSHVFTIVRSYWASYSSCSGGGGQNLVPSHLCKKHCSDVGSHRQRIKPYFVLQIIGSNSGHRLGRVPSTHPFQILTRWPVSVLSTITQQLINMKYLSSNIFCFLVLNTTSVTHVKTLLISVFKWSNFLILSSFHELGEG